MLTNEQKANLAKTGNELLLTEFAKFLQGYPEEEKIMGVKLDHEGKLYFLVSAFKAVLGKLKETDPSFLTDPFIRATLVNSIQVPSSASKYWHLALKQAESELA